MVFGMAIAALIVGGPLGYASYRQGQLRHFRVVHDGVLYRSGQLSLAGLQRVVHDYGIRTVVTLRDADTLGKPAPDLEEEDYCRCHGLHYCRITPRHWDRPDGTIPAEVGVRQFLAVMDDPANQPVLIHCFAGVHRTGAYCAVYRIEYEGWSNAAAIAEMKRCGYLNLDEELDVLGYVERYRRRSAPPAPQNPAAAGPNSARGLPPVQ
jgi:protein tyrosine/serine phosphatase